MKFKDNRSGGKDLIINDQVIKITPTEYKELTKKKRVGKKPAQKQ